MRVIVIGGGIIGASVGYHLSARGVDVAVLTGGKPGGIATADSFAWINAAPGNSRTYHELRVKAILDWHRLQSEMGEQLEINWNGSIWWDADTDSMAGAVSDHAALGYPINLISPEHAAHREPSLKNPPEMSALSAVEGSLSPVEVTLKLLDAAAQNGAQVIDEQVEELLLEGGRITGVKTAAGEKMANHVVLAAGVACEALAAQIGVTLPTANLPGFLAQSTPLPPILNGLVLSPKLHMRQNSDGRIIVGEDFGGGPPPEDESTMAETLLESACALLDGIETPPVDRYSLGMRPIPADGHPVIGPTEGADGLYITLMHSGVTLAALVGRLAAEEIVTGRPVEILEPYRLERFHRG